MPIHGDGGHAAVVSELPLDNPHGWIIAVGDNAIRQKEAVARQYEYGDDPAVRALRRFARAIHPSAIISPSATIGEGTVVMAGAIVQARAQIGAHCIINTGASVDHDCIIEDFAHIAPGAHLCGGVHVGEGSLVGVGSCAIPLIKIGSWAIVGAGAVVVRDVADGVTVVGCPAK